jgi:hypothetical protein
MNKHSTDMSPADAAGALARSLFTAILDNLVNATCGMESGPICSKEKHRAQLHATVSI